MRVWSVCRVHAAHDIQFCLDVQNWKAVAHFGLTENNHGIIGILKYFASFLKYGSSVTLLPCRALGQDEAEWQPWKQTGMWCGRFWGPLVILSILNPHQQSSSQPVSVLSSFWYSLGVHLPYYFPSNITPLSLEGWDLPKGGRRRDGSVYWSHRVEILLE